MKLFRPVLILALVIAAPCLFLNTACRIVDRDLVFCTVSFDTDGGTPSSIAPVQVLKGGKMGSVYPDDPQKDGYVFGGWYDGNVRYRQERPVIEKDLTLKAKWNNPPVTEDPKEKFHVYLAFGQSNMVGYLGLPITSSGSTTNTAWVADNGYDTPPDNFVVMGAANTSRLPYGREKGQWYSAVPPLVRSGNGLSPADFFGRTVAEAVAGDGIKVGIIAVGVDGCQVILFAKDIDVFKNYIGTQQSWMTGQAEAYIDDGVRITSANFTTEDYPFKRLVDLAKQAQEEGVIKGIIMHQGESGGNFPGKSYAQSVRQIYDDLCADLDIEPGSIPFLAGQAVGNNNNNIASIPAAFADIPNTAHVIPSDGCLGWDPNSSDSNARIHFSLAGYEELGRRYGQKMLELNRSGSGE